MDWRAQTKLGPSVKFCSLFDPTRVASVRRNPATYPALMLVGRTHKEPASTK
jgi:hypothetical protein